MNDREVLIEEIKQDIENFSEELKNNESYQKLKAEKGLKKKKQTR